MIKTGVYLSDEEAASLRRLSAATGESQAELIRRGIRLITDEEPRRRFASRAIASGPPYSRPTADEVDAHIRGVR